MLMCDGISPYVRLFLHLWYYIECMSPRRLLFISLIRHGDVCIHEKLENMRTYVYKPI